ncbi:sugar ABC transporter substrate-binding protein, partial [Amycolatopsis tucumanensis]|nr:sugar ABC transporter substrate-binding protein [Amycolatopsis tucumanensis]
MRIGKSRMLRISGLAAAAVLAVTGCSTGGSAQTTAAGNNQVPPTASAGELRDHALNSLQGKTAAFVPVGMGTPLMEEWNRQLERGFKAAGMNYVLRDPNWDTAKQAEAVQSLINEKPAVLVVHNF